MKYLNGLERLLSKIAFRKSQIKSLLQDLVNLWQRFAHLLKLSHLWQVTLLCDVLRELVFLVNFVAETLFPTWLHGVLIVPWGWSLVLDYDAMMLSTLFTRWDEPWTWALASSFATSTSTIFNTIHTLCVMHTGIPQSLMHLRVSLNCLGPWHHIFGVSIYWDKLHPIALTRIGVSLVHVILEQAVGLAWVSRYTSILHLW